GVRARAPRLYLEELAPILAPVVREVFGYRERLTFDRALYSMVTTPPGRLSLAQRIPHIDGVEEGMIAILHYLSPQDRGGTGFYRHISTGFETVDATRHGPYLEALQADFARHGEPAAGYIEGDTAFFPGSRISLRRTIARSSTAAACCIAPRSPATRPCPPMCARGD
ncbi:MAG: hypothetical protein CVT76_08890, partial [Alphaproteobacteria bacterium HGW-Alphaproteobacteria-15]